MKRGGGVRVPEKTNIRRNFQTEKPKNKETTGGGGLGFLKRQVCCNFHTDK